MSRTGSFYHMNDVSVYLGRQRWGGVPGRKSKLEVFLVVSVPSAIVSNIYVKNAPFLIQN